MNIVLYFMLYCIDTVIQVAKHHHKSCHSVILVIFVIQSCLDRSCHELYANSKLIPYCTILYAVLY